MASGLEDLFGQILVSEQKAQQQKTLVNEVRNKVNKCLEEVNKLREQSKQLQSENFNKEQTLNDVELQTHWKSKELAVLEKQQNKLELQQKKLESELKDISDKLERERENFGAAVETFCNQYDLVSHGEQQREAKCREELKQLQQQEEQLQKELTSFQQHQTNIDVLSTQDAEYVVKVEAEQQSISGLESKLQKERERTEKLRQERDKVAAIPHTQLDFTRLQRELDGYRDNHVESMCKALEQELQGLQQLQWQRQIKQRKDHQSFNRQIPKIQQPNTRQNINMQNQSRSVGVTYPNFNKSYMHIDHNDCTSALNDVNHNHAQSQEDDSQELTNWPSFGPAQAAKYKGGFRPARRPINLSKLSSAIKHASQESADNQENSLPDMTEPICSTPYRSANSNSDEPSIKRQKSWDR